MRLLQTLQLLGLRVLLPLLSALLCVSAELWEPGCPDPDHATRRAIGEQWLLPNCGGVATCMASASGSVTVAIDSCPGTGACRKLDDGDPSATFPACCPRQDCPGCYSEKLGRHFESGVSWTEGHCLRRRCEIGPSGEIMSFVDGCEPLGPPPSLECEVVGQDMARGEHPLCCAHYRCPGLCRAGDRWRLVDAVRGDSCDARVPGPQPVTGGVASRSRARPSQPGDPAVPRQPAAAGQKRCPPGVWGC